MCSPSNTITSPIFGDDLLKNVKDIAEANEISSTIHGRRRLAVKGRGSLQAPTAALLTGQISTMHPGQKTTSAPPPLPNQEGSGQEEEAATTGETSIKKPLSISPPEKDQMPLATSHVTTLVCRTKYFIPAWQEITADRQILEMVRGCPIEF